MLMRDRSIFPQSYVVRHVDGSYLMRGMHVTDDSQKAHRFVYWDDARRWIGIMGDGWSVRARVYASSVVIPCK